MAFCLVFCSTLAALVSVIPVLCSLILRSLRDWVLWEPLDSLLSIKLLQQGPSLVLPFAYLSLFPLGSADSRVIFILNPRGQCSSECWSNLSAAGDHQGQLWVGLPESLTIRCALRTRYVQLLSGFVGTFRRSCCSCFTIVEMSCNRDSESDRVFLGEGISFVDRESL